MADKKRFTALLLAGALAIALAGCGGGGHTPPPPPPPEEPLTIEIESTVGLDGYLLKQPSITMVMNDSTKVMTGDFYNSGTGQKGTYRAFISFDVSALAGAEIQEAVFKIYRYSGGDAVAKLGNVLLEQVNYGDSLGGNDYALAAIGTAADLVTDDTVGWKQVDVTAAVEYALAQGWTRCQFRLRHAADTAPDNNGHVASWYQAGSAAAEKPVLRVTYLPAD